MKTILLILNVLVKVYKRLRGFFPQALPVGLSEFEAWSKEVLETAGAPVNESTRFALAVQVLHSPPTASHKPKEHFIRNIRKAMTNQVASHVINDLKEKQDAARKLENESK